MFYATARASTKHILKNLIMSWKNCKYWKKNERKKTDWKLKIADLWMQTQAKVAGPTAVPMKSIVFWEETTFRTDVLCQSFGSKNKPSKKK
jgi:hypothetical protein